MDLGSRARAVARAQPADGRARGAVVVGGLVAVGVAALTGQPWIAVPAAFALGYAFRPEAERYYLEGFSDGLVAAAVDGPAAADERAGVPRDDGSVRGEPRGDAGDAFGTDRTAARSPIRRFGAPPDAGKPVPYGVAYGVRADAGPPRPALDATGEPTTYYTDRPRYGSVVPAADVGRPPVVIGPYRAEAGDEADPRVSPV